MTRTETVFILQSYVQRSLWIVVSYVWTKRQEGLWLWSECKIQYSLIAVYFPFSVAQRCVLKKFHDVIFGINFSTGNWLAIHANFPDLVGIFPILCTAKRHSRFPDRDSKYHLKSQFSKNTSRFTTLTSRFPTQIQNPTLVLWA